MDPFDDTPRIFQNYSGHSSDHFGPEPLIQLGSLIDQARAQGEIYRNTWDLADLEKQIQLYHVALNSVSLQGTINPAVSQPRTSSSFREGHRLTIRPYKTDTHFRT